MTKPKNVTLFTVPKSQAYTMDFFQEIVEYMKKVQPGSSDYRFIFLSHKNDAKKRLVVKYISKKEKVQTIKELYIALFMETIIFDRLGVREAIHKLKQTISINIFVYSNSSRDKKYNIATMRRLGIPVTEIIGSAGTPYFYKNNIAAIKASFAFDKMLFITNSKVLYNCDINIPIISTQNFIDLPPKKILDYGTYNIIKENV